MDRKGEALKLSRDMQKKILDFGTEIDEYYRKFRELRVLTDDLSFQGALINVEHAFFMVVQSLNILKEQLKLLEVASKKGEIY
ncbi:conserved hypothetical protein [Hydrogenobacter thermophilus TK-6]|uniref:Uncharacterized protein n=1 Tax=Hydrogenobacter thermophilus (strain DSM 6534 / IAM 12695 / TK-6) TaxID=608538 RepID=D3DH93_HYDTT|nr:hypothetical protein [Hydrogenobacter thermophilus]ADO45133.1 conserved hypothetical protein [Hydrogenobacter thermophilus TK-6]BAI69195.1 hypothetical protein HTH_0735 [Hydrogenobacter thermophilus TK-6]